MNLVVYYREKVYRLNRKFRKLTSIFQLTPFTIDTLNTATEEVLIRCRGTRAHINTTIEEMITMPDLIPRLPSIQACWVGYYFANPQNKNFKRKLKNVQLGFTLQNKDGKFKICSFDNLTSELTYIDMHTKRVYKEKIGAVVQNRYMISNIHPTQAYMLGMEAGFIVARHGTEILTIKSEKPALKLVK